MGGGGLRGKKCGRFGGPKMWEVGDWESKNVGVGDWGLKNVGGGRLG